MQREVAKILLSTVRITPNVCRYIPCSYLHTVKIILCAEKPSWKYNSVENKTEFTNANPDVFGTLSSNKNINQILEKMPEEKDDVIEFQYTDDKGKARRRPLEYYAKLIQDNFSKKKIVDALDILETRMLKQDRIEPNYYIYNLLINGCAKAGYCKKAFQLYKQMKERKIKKTPPTITGLFNACALSPFPEEALVKLNHLRKTLQDESWDLSMLNYHALVKAYARLSDLKSAFLVVDEMMNKGYSLNTETFAFLLQACISDKTSGFGYALLVWRRMIDKKIPPSIFTYNLLIRCVRDCGLGPASSVEKIIETIIKGKLSSFKNYIDCGSTNSKLIENSNNNNDSELLNQNTACQMTSELDQIENKLLKENRPNLLSKTPHMGDIVAINEVKTAQDRLLLLGGFQNVLNQMDADNVRPNIKTYSQLLEIIPGTITAEEILLAHMKKYKVELNIDFCNLLIKKRSMRCDYENARNVLNLIQENFLNPDIVTFGVLAMSCKKKWEAESLMRDIREFGFSLNAEILGGMLKQACFHYSFDYIIYIMQTVVKMGIQPNEKFMEHLNTLYTKISDHMKLIKKKKVRNVPLFVTKPEFIEGFQMFKEYFSQWKKMVTVYKPPHPYKQFKNLETEVKINETSDKPLNWKNSKIDSVNKTELYL